jgi:hypothetical protein
VMGFIALKWLITIIIPLNFWSINIEYVELKTEGECNYSFRSYLPKLVPGNVVDSLRDSTYSIYGTERIREEISNYYNDFPCFFPGMERQDLRLSSEYHFRDWPNLVLLNYHASNPHRNIWVVYADDRHKCYILSSFCGGSLIDNYNRIIRENPSPNKMPLICRAMLLLSLSADIDILKDEEDLEYINYEKGLGWDLYRYNLPLNVYFIVMLNTSYRDLERLSYPEGYDPPRPLKEVLLEKYQASDKNIEAPSVTHEENNDIVHLTVFQGHPSNCIEFWEIGFDSKNGFLKDFKKVDSICEE